MNSVGVGLLGFGTVGSALVARLRDQGQAIGARTGLDLQTVRVAVRDPAKGRVVDLPDGVVVGDAEAVVDDPEVEVVVELMGGVEPARSLILKALAAGKPVVTANKELLARHGGELFAAAEATGVDLLFEAAVGGGIPMVRPLRESLAGEPVETVLGIVNGTTNYILTRMTEEGSGYAEALAEAQELGFAEADPTADVDGHDAAAKIAILASIAFGVQVTADDVYREGIRAVTPADLREAERSGHVVKLVAAADRVPGPVGTVAVAVRVYPALVPLNHPLASVRDSFNAVFVQGSHVGELMLYGRGAGGDPTASAVLGDLVDAAGNRRLGTAARLGSMRAARIVPVGEHRCEFMIRLLVTDRSGVLASVATAFSDHDVSIRSMLQEEPGDLDVDGTSRIVFISHEAREADVRATLTDIATIDTVINIESVIRLLPESTPLP
jgi:homoserine dehydrogenase